MVGLQRDMQGVSYSESADFEHHDREIHGFLSMLDHFGLTLASDGLIADVGGGQGMHAWTVAGRCRRMYVCDIIDYSALYKGEFLRLLAEKHERNGRPLDLSKVSFVTSDACNQIFRTALFDCVFSFNVMEHVPSPHTCLKEILRITRPGGIIFLQFDPIWTSPWGNHFSHLVGDPWAHLLYTDDEFCAVMRSAGGTEADAMDFRTAMNRVSLQAFRTMFREEEALGRWKIVSEVSWPSRPEDESAIAHPNFERLQKLGYTAEELTTRGIQVLATRTHAP